MAADGEIVVQLEEDDVAAETEKWNLSLVAYVVGNTPSIGAMERFIANQWNFVTKPKVLLHNDGYFVIRFASAKDRNAVLFFGPYTLYNQLIILRSWSVDFDFNEEVLRTILLGVKLPNMPLKCWSERSLSKIGSGLGKPIYADECTSKAERISYSRLLIEMDVSRPLPGTIKVCDPIGKIIDQPLAYDWKPQYCHICCQIGHNCKLNNTLQNHMDKKYSPNKIT
nr:uncharacterized protein LOC104105983 [Nicotiana tomentosiformis]